MLILRFLLLGVILLVVPTMVGSLFTGVDRQHKNFPFMWISGQMLLWAGFQLIAVPLVLTEGRFEQVVGLYTGCMCLCLLVAAIVFAIRKKRGSVKLHAVENPTSKEKRKIYILWAVFWGILLFQVIQSFCLAYADGDDAFYVATATIAEESNTMYQKLAYTGGTTGVDVRYALAPFPLWIAFLARISGIQTVIVAQTLVPPVLIAMAYGVYYLLGTKLFAKQKERIPLYLIFVELLVLFGDYSMYTSEKFLIARSRQGKAALSAIVIPFLFYLLLLLLQKLEENRRMSVAYWGLLVSALTAACLCSTLGAVLTCMLIGITGLCGAVCYRKWKLLIPLAACCLPCVLEALLYLMH